MTTRFSNIGEARKEAQACADRDQCKWRVYLNPYNGSREKFVILTEYEYASSYMRKVAEVAPSPAKSDDKKAVLLTKDERRLVAAVLHPDEIGRDFYDGTEETKVSLFKKLTRRG